MQTIDEEKNERDKLVHFEEDEEKKEDKKDGTEKLMEKKNEAETKA